MPENILPLALGPHDEYHSTGKLAGVVLTREEMEYLGRKLGREAAADYVRRKFAMEVAP